MVGRSIRGFLGKFYEEGDSGDEFFLSKIIGCGFKLQQGLLFIECLRAAFRRLPVQNKCGVLVLMLIILVVGYFMDWCCKWFYLVVAVVVNCMFVLEKKNSYLLILSYLI